MEEEKEKDIEAQLIPRLRFMGILMLLFSGSALAYALLFATDISPALAQEFAQDSFLSPREREEAAGFIEDDLIFIPRSGYYFISLGFALVGGCCLLYVRHKCKEPK